MVFGTDNKYSCINFLKIISVVFKYIWHDKVSLKRRSSREQQPQGKNGYDRTEMDLYFVPFVEFLSFGIYFKIYTNETSFIECLLQKYKINVACYSKILYDCLEFQYSNMILKYKIYGMELNNIFIIKII